MAMRIVGLCGLIGVIALAACHRETTADAVKANYDNRADAIERQADAQPTDVAKRIYKDQADAMRQEGQERSKGLKKAGVDNPPPMPGNAQ
jgi:hypothetical protein